MAVSFCDALARERPRLPLGRKGSWPAGAEGIRMSLISEHSEICSKSPPSASAQPPPPLTARSTASGGLRKPLDKSRVSAIIKITQGSATSGFASGLRRKLDQKIKKPSLCRVAVSAFDADGDRESKDMECDRNRHLITSFTR